MKNTKSILFLVTVLIVSFLMSTNVYGVSSNQKKLAISKTAVVEKAKVPVMAIPQITRISQDLTPGYTLEVYGKFFGIKTFTTKFIVGGYNAIIKGWGNDFILLKFPDSPTLGKKIKSYIMKGNKIVSNQFEHKLMALAGELKPSSVLSNYNPLTQILLGAAWCGTNKQGMSLRFKKIKPIAMIKPVYSKVISITQGSSDLDYLKARLPIGLTEGTYLVELIQDGRVAAEPPLEFKVNNLLPLKKKIRIK